jgi:archaellum component FlaG (FlaF/FlaG flagellin family)
MILGRFSENWSIMLRTKVTYYKYSLQVIMLLILLLTFVGCNRETNKLEQATFCPPSGNIMLSVGGANPTIKEGNVYLTVKNYEPFQDIKKFRFFKKDVLIIERPIIDVVYTLEVPISRIDNGKVIFRVEALDDDDNVLYKDDAYITANIPSSDEPSTPVKDWQPLGGVVGIVRNTGKIDLVSDGKNTIIAFVEGDEQTPDYKIVVKRWSGSQWEQVGPAVAEGDINGIGLSIKLDKAGNPIVVWIDGDYDTPGNVYAKGFNGTTWEFLGDSWLITKLSRVRHLIVKSDREDGFYVLWAELYTDDFSTTRAYVKHFDGSKWRLLGDGPAFIDRPNNVLDLDFDIYNRPVIALGDRFLYFDGDSWKDQIYQSLSEDIAGSDGYVFRIGNDNRPVYSESYTLSGGEPDGSPPVPPTEKMFCFNGDSWQKIIDSTGITQELIFDDDGRPIILSSGVAKWNESSSAWHSVGGYAYYTPDTDTKSMIKIGGKLFIVTSTLIPDSFNHEIRVYSY